jgi:predicted transport protein
VDHKGDFTLAAQKQLGKDIEIDWSSPRLILVAESFSEYDKYAVNRIGANIQLWTYRKYGSDFLFLESIFATTNSKPSKKEKVEVREEASEDTLEEEVIYTLEYHLGEKPADTKLLFDALRERIFALNSDGDIIEKPNKIYLSYKHGKNFCEVQIQANRLKIWLDIPHVELDDPAKLSRDVSKIGHHGTGTSETNLSDLSELDAVMSLIEQSYKQTV